MARRVRWSMDRARVRVRRVTARPVPMCDRPDQPVDERPEDGQDNNNDQGDKN